MQSLLRQTLREDILLTLVAEPALWTAIVDPVQLETAILNLCLNARDAMPQGGELTLETSNVWLASPHDERLFELQPGQYVMIAVSDNGAGISTENMGRIFEPFFTTKQVGQGSGLGLSMVYGFAKQSLGTLTVYSELGTGSCFKLYLPKADEGEEVPDINHENAVIGGSQKILLVEDDPLVLKFAVEQLVSLGYRVSSASNGADALKHLRQEPDFDILFTDMVMPGGMNGHQLAEQALDICATIKVLIASGYTDHTFAKTDVVGFRRHFLSKPYSHKQLARKLSSILSED